ncbi:MAG: hypothetical protein JF563_07510, partial [Acidobacteriales bacterium]|nr:hypothetical protein [Terriglobales bacterium]
MKSSECKRKSYRFSRRCPDLLVLAMLAPGASTLVAHGQDPQAITQQIQDLKSAMATTQAQLEQSQRQLEKMKQQLNTLELQVTQTTPTSNPAPDLAAAPAATQQNAADLAAAVDDLREQQAMQATQIATLDQTKVESESKYPVKIT